MVQLPDKMFKENLKNWMISETVIAINKEDCHCVVWNIIMMWVDLLNDLASPPMFFLMSPSVFQPWQAWQQYSRWAVRNNDPFIIHPHVNLVVTVGVCVWNCFTPENRSSTGSVSKSDPGSPEKANPRGDIKPEPAARVKAASLCSSPGGAINPKPPVPQGTKPALAARPTIPLKPRTASNRSIGTPA